MIIKYRIATECDAESIYRLQVKTYIHKYHEDITLIRNIIGYNMSYVVETGCRGEGIIGYALIHRIPNSLSPPELGRVEDCPLSEALCIHDFVIAQDAQRKGVGHMFLRYLIATLEYKSITIVALPQAIPFWEKNKFVPVYLEDVQSYGESYGEHAQTMLFKP